MSVELKWILVFIFIIVTPVISGKNIFNYSFFSYLGHLNRIIRDWILSQFCARLSLLNASFVSLNVTFVADSF